MTRIPRAILRRHTELRQRVSQSMSDSGGFANEKCRRLQRKLAQLQQIKKALRHL